MKHQAENEIPVFMQKYYDAIDEEGQIYLDRLAGNYHRDRQDFMMTAFVAKSNLQIDWNKVTGENKKLDPEQIVAASGLNTKYEQDALSIAKKHGYIEHNEEESADQQADEPEDEQRQADSQDAASHAASASTLEQQDDQSHQDIDISQSEFSKRLQELRERQSQKIIERAQAPEDKTDTQMPQTDAERFAAKLAEMRAAGQSKTRRPGLH